MGEMDWLGVSMAALAASAVLALTFRIKRAGWLIAAAPLNFVSALMLGHALARIGPEKLAAKPQLYFMQSGGLALAFMPTGDYAADMARVEEFCRSTTPKHPGKAMKSIMAASVQSAEPSTIDKAA